MGELVAMPVGAFHFFAGVVSWERSDSRSRVVGVVGVAGVVASYLLLHHLEMCFVKHYCQHWTIPLLQVEHELFSFTERRCQKGGTPSI